MIENDEQLDATLQALGCLYRALSSLRKSILPVNPRQYALFAEGPSMKYLNYKQKSMTTWI